MATTQGVLQTGVETGNGNRMAATSDAARALDRALERARRRKRTRSHSALFVAMVARANVLGEVLRSPGRPTWRMLAEELAAEGLTTSDGRPFAASTVKSTYYRARRALASAGVDVTFGDPPKMKRRQTGKGRRKAPKLPPDLSTSGSEPPADDPDEPRPAFKTARLRGGKS